MEAELEVWVVTARRGSKEAKEGQRVATRSQEG
jgi:hypothetical protein